MWSIVAPCDVESPAPSARSKHSATLVGDQVYLLGGRNGNLPMKDFWKYNLVTGKWQQLKPGGDKLPCLQEHTAVAYKENIYVFGGEMSFSAGTETPLWVYNIKGNNWKKIKSRPGVSAPKGRRGHSALVYKEMMLVYGGYQDLKGSSSELWAFHFDTESWHLISSTPTKGDTPCGYPPPRHKHSAVLHDDSMWVYGGMTDLQERADLWRWDIRSRTWTTFKTKLNPGPLHSHAACRLPSSMIVFGGEHDGHPTNDLWKFNFSGELWEKINTAGIRPQPRSESAAFTVSELLLQGNSTNSHETKSSRIRQRTCASADRGNRHSSYFPGNKISPYEKTYVFEPSQGNYIDGSDLAQQYSEGTRASRSILHEISKLSQLRLNKCNYSALAGCPTDSTESLLKQHISPQGCPEVGLEEIGTSTPTRGTMVKSKSAYVIKKKYSTDTSPEEGVKTERRRVEFSTNVTKIPREPISVPNFSVLTLPTPVLTPVEAARLVFLDMEEENDLEYDSFLPPSVQEYKEEAPMFDTFKPVKRGESYSSHLAYADNPLYQHLVNSNSTNNNCTNETVPETSDENVSSTSDYASIETMNRLSSSSNYSVKTSHTPVEPPKPPKSGEGRFGFCNPNYLGPDIKSLLNGEPAQKQNISKLLGTPDSLLEESNAHDDNPLEMQSYNGTITRNTKVLFRNTRRDQRPPKSLVLDNCPHKEKCRASSASRAERHRNVGDRGRIEAGVGAEAYLPLYVFVVGGKEQGQVTVFRRPLSVWKLKMF